MSDWIKVISALGGAVIAWYIQSQKQEFRIDATEKWQSQHETAHNRQYEALDGQITNIQRDLDQLIGRQQQGSRKQ